MRHLLNTSGGVERYGEADRMSLVNVINRRKQNYPVGAVSVASHSISRLFLELHSDRLKGNGDLMT